MKISKKLRNVIEVYDQKEKVNEFVERIKDETQYTVVYVKMPKDIKKLDSSFVDSNWNTKRIDEVVFVGKAEPRTIVLFSDIKSLEKTLERFIKGQRINCTHTKISIKEANGKVIIKEYYDGMKVIERDEEINPNKYSVCKYID